MEEYRLDLKVRNNIILYKLEKAGYKTLGEFCRINNVMKYITHLGNIINMKESPLQSDGEFKKSVLYIADFFGCSPIDLFTDTQLHTILKTNKRSIQVNEAEMKVMLEQQNRTPLLENMVLNEQRNNAITKILCTVTPRERKIIEMRMGLLDREYTLREVAEELGITNERVRQIEAKALRKLRHPERAEKLEEFLNECIK